MDDILASIRKIISEDPDAQTASDGGQNPAGASHAAAPNAAVPHQDYSTGHGPGTGDGPGGAPFQPGGMSARPTENRPRDEFGIPRREDSPGASGESRSAGPDPFADFRPGAQTPGSAAPLPDERHARAEPALPDAHQPAFGGGPAGWPDSVDTPGDPRLPFDDLDSFTGDGPASGGREPDAAAYDRDAGRDAFAERDRSFAPGAEDPADLPPLRASGDGGMGEQRPPFGFGGDTVGERSGYEPRMSEFVTAESGLADRGAAFAHADTERNGGDGHWPGDETTGRAQAHSDSEPAADEPVVLDAPLRGGQPEDSAGADASPGVAAMPESAADEDYVELGTAMGSNGAEPLDPGQPVDTGEPVHESAPKRDEAAAMSFEENARRPGAGDRASTAPGLDAEGDADRQEQAAAASGPAAHVNGLDPDADLQPATLAAEDREPEPVDLGALARPAGEPQSQPLAETRATEDAESTTRLDAPGEPSALEDATPEPDEGASGGDVVAQAGNAEAPGGAAPPSGVATDAPAGEGAVAAQVQQAAADAGGRTVEEMVAGLLKPVLREWLDDNMPRIIEKAISKDDLLASPDDDADKS